MPRDNEKIIEIINECQKFCKSYMTELIYADASAETLRMFSEALLSLEHATNSMGENHSGNIIRGTGVGILRALPVESDSSQLREIVREVAQTMINEKFFSTVENLDEMQKKTDEKMKPKSNVADYQPGDSHFDEEYR